MAYELYQTLEISPQALAEEIKRAYYRLVRKHSPEKDPERFKQIREAYETLSDAKAKQNYDSLQEYGDQIQDLLDQAEEKMQAEEWSSAISLLKRVLVLAPRANAARNRLGICYTRNCHWEAAEKVYLTLTKDNPEVPLYWSNFGQVYKQQAESSNDEYDDKAKFYHQARECFQKAVELESFNSEHYLEIARTYLDENNYSQALVWAERSISADQKADFNDFDTLFFICIVYLRSDELQNIEETAQRIASLLPDSEDARRYAASRFATIGLDLAKIGTQQVHVRALRAAFKFLKTARDFDPSDVDIKEVYEQVEEMMAALEQYEILKEDSRILNGFQRLAAFCLANYFSLHGSEQEKETALDDILTEIRASPSQSIISSITRLKSYYPALYGLNKGLFDEIEKVEQELKAKESGSSPSRDSRTAVPPSPPLPPPPPPIHTSALPSDSKDWRNAVIIGSLIGGAIIIGLALTRTPQIVESPVTNNSPSTSSTSPQQAPSLTQEQAVDLIERWIQAKRELFAAPFNRQLAAELITGKLYGETLGSEGSIAWLENNGAYYRYGVQKLDSVEQFFVSGSDATIEVIVIEERTLYKKNGTIDAGNTALDTRLVRYTLQADNGQWKIAAYKTVKIIQKR